jgi:hypothetical protein
MPELDTHGLFLFDSIFFNEGNQVLAIHPNGYSCHSLAERILSAWSSAGSVSIVMEQFDYILRCGGLGRERSSIECIARGVLIE